RRAGARPGGPHLAAVPAGGETPGYEGETTDCWFGEPEPGDRRSWALPSAHGTYRGLGLELLDPGEEDDRAILIEALPGALWRDRNLPAGPMGWHGWPGRGECA